MARENADYIASSDMGMALGVILEHNGHIMRGYVVSMSDENEFSIIASMRTPKEVITGVSYTLYIHGNNAILGSSRKEALFGLESSVYELEKIFPLYEFTVTDENTQP